MQPFSQSFTITFFPLSFHSRHLELRMSLPSVHRNNWLFESPRCRTVIQALQPNLRDDMALKEKEVRQITNQNCSRQLLTSHTAQRSVQRPIGRSPIAPNKPLRSANLHATHSRNGHVDAHASCA